MRTGGRTGTARRSIAPVAASATMVEAFTRGAAKRMAGGSDLLGRSLKLLRPQGRLVKTYAFASASSATLVEQPCSLRYLPHQVICISHRRPDLPLRGQSRHRPLALRPRNPEHRRAGVHCRCLHRRGSRSHCPSSVMPVATCSVRTIPDGRATRSWYNTDGRGCVD